MAPPRQVREFSGIKDEALLHQLHMTKMRLSTRVSISRILMVMVVTVVMAFVSAQPGGFEWMERAWKFIPWISRLSPP